MLNSLSKIELSGQEIPWRLCGCQVGECCGGGFHGVSSVFVLGLPGKRYEDYGGNLMDIDL